MAVTRREIEFTQLLLGTAPMFLGFLVSKTMNSRSFGQATYEESRHPSWTPLLVLFPPLLPFFWSYRVKYDGDELLFGYNTNYCSKTIKKSKIQRVESCTINGLSDWGGWGIRHSWNQDGWGYIAENGPGVKFLDSESNKYYTFSCKDPNKLIEVLHAQTE
jgi:hypothetical protein